MQAQAAALVLQQRAREAEAEAKLDAALQKRADRAAKRARVEVQHEQPKKPQLGEQQSPEQRPQDPKLPAGSSALLAAEFPAAVRDKLSLPVAVLPPGQLADIAPPVLKETSRSVVFRELWKNGWFLTDGLAFGCDFLAYPGSKLHCAF